jgi:predicted metalloendopeptidase
MKSRAASTLRMLAGIAALIGFALPSGAASSGSGLDLSNVDRSVPPSVDFYRFAIGGWLARTTIPADRAEWGSFDQADRTTIERLRRLLESPDQSLAPVGSERRKVGDFYAACTDLEGIEANGLSALAPVLRRIAALRSVSQLASVAAESFALVPSFANSPLFSFGPEQNPKDATHVIASLSQGGLTMDTRDDYLERDPHSLKIRRAYAAYVGRVFALLGDSAARGAAETRAVLSLETALAKASKEPADLRDPLANYHPMPMEAVVSLSPHFAWRLYFAGTGLSNAHAVLMDVGQPGFFTALDALLSSAPLDSWKSYLRWHAVSGNTAAEPKAFRIAALAFRRAYYGVTSEPPRSESCTRATSNALGFAVGSLYARSYFPPKARARARREVASIKAQLHEDLETLAWMGPVTRAHALAKLAKLNTSKVGYPDHPLRYTRLTVGSADYLADVIAANRFEFRRQIAKIGKPTDRSDWGITPQTVNAYYDPSMNEIVVPAGILQPPFFDPNADDAVNFGGIGAVIGHELTHGFDDQGTDYDGDGNLKPWISPRDAARFRVRVGCIIAQANAYAVGDGLDLHLNGRLVAGEATADLGGITLSFRALQASLGGRPAAPIAGFTAQQRFYLSFAQIWRSKIRPLAERAQVLGDPHPVSRYRVDATVSDADPFYAAFGVAPGTPMYREPGKRCRIW